MKEVVMWTMLVSFFIGSLMVWIGRIIEKTYRVMEILEREEWQSKLVKRGKQICLTGAGMMAIGMLLFFFVYPKL